MYVSFGEDLIDLLIPYFAVIDKDDRVLNTMSKEEEQTTTTMTEEDSHLIPGPSSPKAKRQRVDRSNREKVQLLQLYDALPKEMSLRESSAFLKLVFLTNIE